jgi:hypothetical protein
MNTKTLLRAGVAAGPLFITVVLAQLLTRDGFNIMHHPISLLSLGGTGWVQITNFIVTGALCLAFAAGLSRALGSGLGHLWVPRLMSVFGVGLIVGGVFVPDPALGYPLGTPDSIPKSWTVHGTIHAFAPPLAFTALVVCALVMARRDRASGQPGWAAYCALSGLGTLILTAWPDQNSASWRLALGVLVGFGWVTALAVRELARPSGRPGTLGGHVLPHQPVHGDAVGPPNAEQMMTRGRTRVRTRLGPSSS